MQDRKLAAIMFIDIADFTALSGKDEQKALALLDQLNYIHLYEEYYVKNHEYNQIQVVSS